MNKLWIIIFLLIFFLFKPTNILAKDASISAMPIHVEYNLPYPGLLPDNPLYYLKAIRDNVLKFFISDPLKKADFDLLSANKRLVAAQFLLQRGRVSLSITTLSKSGNYFDDAISNIQMAKKQGANTSSLLTELFKAAQKHQEVIRSMEKNQKGDTLLNLRILEERAKSFQDRVEIIQSY